MNVLFVNPNLRYFTVPNLGLAYVMTNVARRHRIKLLDFTFHGQAIHGVVEKEIGCWIPDIIALSVNSFTVQDGFIVAAMLRKNFPAAKMVWGGVHPTLFPEEMLSHPLVDAVCIGEGELPFSDLLERLERNAPLTVENVWHKFSGTVLRNPIRGFNQDLDMLLSPDWTLWDIQKYVRSSQFFYGSIVYIASRGCVYNCSFCSAPVLRKLGRGRYYRLRDPSKVVEQVHTDYQTFRQRGFKTASFVDSLFGIHKPWLEEFCRQYHLRGLAKVLPWHCQMRADAIDRHVVELMRSAGCMLIDLGIESGSFFMRNHVYHKDIPGKDIDTAVDCLRKGKMPYKINIIIGGPGETRSMLKESLRLLNRLQPTVIRATFFQPLPKTSLAQSISGGRILNPSGLLNVWDYPRINCALAGRNVLFLIMWQLRLKKFLRALWYGIHAKGLLLPGAIMGYLKECNIPLHHPYAYLGVVDFLEQEYIRYKVQHTDKHAISNR